MGWSWYQSPMPRTWPRDEVEIMTWLLGSQWWRSCEEGGWWMSAKSMLPMLNTPNVFFLSANSGSCWRCESPTWRSLVFFGLGGLGDWMFGKVLKHLKHTWCPRKPVSGNSILLLGYSYRLQLLVQLETHLYSNSAAPKRRPSSQIGALIGWPGLDHDQVSLVYESMSLSVYESMSLLWEVRVQFQTWTGMVCEWWAWKITLECGQLACLSSPKNNLRGSFFLHPWEQCLANAHVVSLQCFAIPWRWRWANKIKAFGNPQCTDCTVKVELDVTRTRT